MRYILLILVAGFILPCWGYTQDIKGLKAIPERNEEIIFDQTYPATKWERLFPGNEKLYAEYGLMAVRRQKLKTGDCVVDIDILKMKDPLSAWGLLSIDSGNSYKYPSDNLLIIIEFDKPTSSDDSKKSMILDQIHGELTSLYPALPSPYYELDSNGFRQVVMVQGPLALTKFLPEWSGYFKGLTHYRFFVSEFVHPENQRLVCFLETDKQQLKHFYHNAGLDRIVQITTLDTESERMVLMPGQKGLTIIVKDRE